MSGNGVEEIVNNDKSDKGNGQLKLSSDTQPDKSKLGDNSKAKKSSTSTKSDKCADDSEIATSNSDVNAENESGMITGLGKKDASESDMEPSFLTEEKKPSTNDLEQVVEKTDFESLLAEGIEFESFDSFQSALTQYSEATGAQFSRCDSLSVDRAHNTTKHKMYNPAIQFTFVNYSCVYGGKKLKSKSLGLRNASSKKCDCPVRLKLSATPDGQRLLVKESKLDCHNHNIEEDKRRLRNLDEETEQEIYNLISLHENKRMARMMVRDKLTKETGKEITLKDICNIEIRVAKKMQRMSEAGSNEKENNTGAAEEDMSYSEDDDNDEGGDSELEDNGNSEKKELSKSSPARPRRHVREPSRFKDFVQKNETKMAAPVTDGSYSEKHHRGLGKPKIKLNESEKIATPVENQAQTPKVGRGKKRKLSMSVPPLAESAPVRSKERDQGQTEERLGKPVQSKTDLKERKIGLLEELLVLEKKKMTMMEMMMGKLDKILENQEKEKCQNG